MTDYQKELIKEHKELCARINELSNDIYGQNTDDKIEYANKCIQLKGMKMYYEALSARIINTGIVIDCDGYFEHIDIDNISSSSSPVEGIVSVNNSNEPIKKTDKENDVVK